MDINLSLSNETFQYEAGRVIYSLFNASIIPSILWIVQRSSGKTNYRDAYLRRRIFAYVILFDFLLYVLSLINAYKRINLPPFNFDFFITLLKDNINNFWWWIPIFWFGFRNQSTREKGFFYAIWQKYKPEYFVSKERLESIDSEWAEKSSDLESAKTNIIQVVMPPSATKEEIYQRLISEIEKNKELKKKFDKSKIKSYEIANPLLGGQEFALIGEDLRTLFVMTGKKLNDIQTQWSGEF